MTEIIIKRRFCGPKDSGNGGYSAGLFAQGVDGPAAVTLRRPPPLNTKIELTLSDSGRFEARETDQLIAIVENATVDVKPPIIPENEAITAAHDAFLSDCNGEHLIPYCFVCGNRRAPGDGLRLFTGPAPASPVNADFWIPADDLADETGLIRPEMIWAALDCPGAFATRVWPKLTLLGRIAVAIERRPAPGERLIVAAWSNGADGRKHFASSAVLDLDRNILAKANTTWIEIVDPAIIEKLRADRDPQ